MQHTSAFRLGIDHAATDPILGWTNLPHTVSGNFVTIEHGIRRNLNETTLRTHAVLAVGDSFTEGWEVSGEESWPAMLEKMTGVPVVNAGIGGYATDQIILRAEQLLPIVMPKILIVGFLEDDVYRSGYSVLGAPKPYFTIESGELRYHPPGPFDLTSSNSLFSLLGHFIRNGLSYFATADFILSRLGPNYWYGSLSDVAVRSNDTDEIEVTCALLERLKQRTDREGVRMALFMQYTAQGILSTGTRTPAAQHVISCALRANIEVVDQFSFIRRIATGRAARKALKKYYIFEGRNFGHMSAQGNWHAAHLLATALRNWLDEVAHVQ